MGTLLSTRTRAKEQQLAQAAAAAPRSASEVSVALSPPKWETMERSPCMLCPSVTTRTPSLGHVWTVDESRDAFAIIVWPKTGCPENCGPKGKGHLSACTAMHSMAVATIVVMFKWPRHLRGGRRRHQPVNRRHSDSALRPYTGLGTGRLGSIGLIWPLYTGKLAGCAMSA